ncbi:hypothetical protein HYY70_03070 [Candidatus Woesearchaeota archaeon]|nr:hypothetical protein [Candidatus Woesearchaeota archaeon]
MIAISFLGILWSFLAVLWNLFVHWLSIFAAPFEEPEMFWILVPIWVNWFFTEFFMEKHGTSFGNAVSNGVIPILASLDWTRYIYRLLAEGTLSLTFGVFLKFMLTFAVFGYGVFVIISGIRIKRIVFYVGRIRWITYVLVMLTPIIYNVKILDFYTMFGIILFFPLYYWIIEIFDRITPEPRVYQQS